MTQTVVPSVEKLDHQLMQQVNKLVEDLAPLSNADESELFFRLLEGLSRFVGVDSVQAFCLNPAEDSFQIVWLGLTGELNRGDWSEIGSSHWRSIFELEECWLESLKGKQKSFPALEKPFLDRCILPLRPIDSPPITLLLQSVKQNAFSLWNHSAMLLFSRTLSSLLQSNRVFNELNTRLLQHQNQETYEPALLEGMLQISDAFVLGNASFLSQIQHDLTAMQSYNQLIQKTIDFYLDEIRLSGDKDALLRVENFTKRRMLPRVLGELGQAMNQSLEGVVRIRSWMDRLKQINANEESALGQVHFVELLSSIIPLAFYEGHIQAVFDVDRALLSPIYGSQVQLQQAFLVLLSLIKKLSSVEKEIEIVRITIEQDESEIRLNFSFETNLSLEQLEQFFQKEALFVHHVMDEHQGRLQSTVQQDNAIVSCSFPVFFSSYDGEEQLSSSFFELNAAAISLDAAMPQEPVESNTKSKTPFWAQEKQKIIIVGDDQAYLNSFKRAIGLRYEVMLAHTVPTSFELLHAHDDFILIFCDLVDNAELSMDFLNELQTQSLPNLPQICFLESERLSLKVRDFTRRRPSLCCPRHGTPQAIESFIREHFVE